MAGMGGGEPTSVFKKQAQASSPGSQVRRALEFAVTVSINGDWPDFQPFEGERSWHLWKTIGEVRAVPPTEPNSRSSTCLSKKATGHQFSQFMSTKQMIDDQDTFCQHL